jgi:uncharacterized membrane protein YccC
VQGRKERPQPIEELPGDTSSRALTAPLIAFAALRALAMAGATAFAFGVGVSHADWTPIATMVALKPSLNQTAVVGAQRVAGALIGAATAALLMLIATGAQGTKLVAIRHVFEVLTIVFFLHGASIRFWNYAIYTAAIAAGALIAVDLPHPSNYSAEGDRVLWTLVGIAIALVVMLLADLLAKRGSKAQPA